MTRPSGSVRTTVSRRSPAGAAVLAREVGGPDRLLPVLFLIQSVESTGHGIAVRRVAWGRSQSVTAGCQKTRQSRHGGYAKTQSVTEVNPEVASKCLWRGRPVNSGGSLPPRRKKQACARCGSPGVQGRNASKERKGQREILRPGGRDSRCVPIRETEMACWDAGSRRVHSSDDGKDSITCRSEGTLFHHASEATESPEIAVRLGTPQTVRSCRGGYTCAPSRTRRAGSIRCTTRCTGKTSCWRVRR